MAILALIVINKAGGLIYNRTFGDTLNQLSTNDYLVLAGTFHGVYAITSRLNPLKGIISAQHQQQQAAAAAAAGGVTIPSRPEPPSGLEVLESENFRLQCFNTLTGNKFLIFTDTMQANVDLVTRKVYDLYSDYVMKNPFYQLDMPIRCEQFDRKLNSYIREINTSR
ncbi:hypothetical protein M426DRAFT_215169 [Hypoxylon sp. CI-4A]|nr:hypothetical protein M426DRAFT_215169 [Hypoxylon sp. CI-4A]